MPAGGVKVSITDINNVELLLVYQGLIHSQTGQFTPNINTLLPGVYFLKFEATMENETKTIQFIKQ